MLQLGVAVAPAAYTIVSNAGKICHVPCKMGDGRGNCKTDFCGFGDVACCRLGLEMEFCNGAIGCKDFQCCVSWRTPPQPPVSPPVPSMPPSPGPPPPPAPLPPPGPPWASCPEAELSYALETESKKEEEDFTRSTAYVLITPWREMLRVVLMLRSGGEYIEVLNVEGATLGRCAWRLVSVRAWRRLARCQNQVA